MSHLKVLIIGGTKYFGRHLALDLIKKNHEVVVFSRGNQDFSFKAQVKHISGDRNNKNELRKVLEHGPFDVVFDQVCMSGKNAEEACEVFQGQCKRYIMTSTGSVYDFANGVEISEDKFDPKTYPINTVDTTPYNYQEAKRQAEAYFLNRASFSVACVRFPIVRGVDDYTKRLFFHVDRVKNNQPIYFPNVNIKMGFIESMEAGEFLSFLGLHSKYQGPVNAVSTGYTSLRELMTLIEEKTQKKSLLCNEDIENSHSPFGADQDFMMANNLGLSLGFKFQNLKDYLPKLIDFYMNEK